VSKLDNAAWAAFHAIADGLRSGPGLSLAARSTIAALSAEASEKGHRSLALALLVIGNAIDPTTTAEVIANTIAGAAEFVTNPVERDILLRAEAAARGKYVMD
jgi:hypothetical protein